MIQYFTLALQYLKVNNMAHKLDKYRTIVWFNPETDEEYTVKYHYEGRYYPATLTEPEEFPELEIDWIQDPDGKEIIEPKEYLVNSIKEYIEENHS